MALFGAPLAHEDHAVRACYAALRMQDTVKRHAEEVLRALGVPVHIRVGLNSGEVVVRSIGSDLHMDYTAVGLTTHLAARMEQMAMPGAILITPDTLRLVEGHALARSLGPAARQGAGRATRGLRGHGRRAGASDKHCRCRERIDTVRWSRRRAGSASAEARARAGRPRPARGGRRRTGRGEVAPLLGIHPFTPLGRLARPESFSVSYGKATPYLPVIELLKGYFKIDDRDDPRAIREKVTGEFRPGRIAEAASLAVLRAP